MTDRVKESLFNRLRSRDVLCGDALDLFAGTGTLGLESLSRGMDHCTFVERDRSALDFLRRNLHDLDLAARASVHRMDALSAAWADLLSARPVRLVLCDPPYRLTEEASGMDRVATMIASLAAVVEPGGLLMLRTQRQTPVNPVSGWEGLQCHLYGSMQLAFYQRGERPSAAQGS